MNYANFILRNFEIRVIPLCVVCSSIFFASYAVAHAQVVISEFAWMGTDTDPNNEWIELYNETSNTIDLTGWTIQGSVTISLSGALTPNGVGVLERTDDDSAPGTALLIYTGALPNQTGGSLVLKDASGAIVDQVVGDANWSNIGGTNEVPKMTPQRTQTNVWVTLVPTPGSVAASGNGHTPSTTNHTVIETKRASSGGGSVMKREAASVAKPVRMPGELSLSIDAPKIGYVGEEIHFEAIPEGVGKTVISSLSYTWNFGDVSSGSGKKPAHQFLFPGEYVVVVEATFAKQIGVTRHEITILPVTIVLSRTQTGDVILKNTAPHEIDMAGYVLSGVSSITFPKFSILKSGGSLTIPNSRLKATFFTPLILKDAQGTVIGEEKSDGDILKSQVLKAVTPPTVPMTQATTTKAPVIETVSAPSTTRIQIGNHVLKNGDPAPGLLSRFLEKLGNFFE